jgi:hypothetical protein
MPGIGVWMGANLTTQGYCLTDDDRRRRAVGLRFSTGACLTLVVAALALESAPFVFALSGVGLVADSPLATRSTTSGTTPRATCSARRSCRPTRGAGATHSRSERAWLAVVGTLLAVGATTAALVLGGLLVAACATVTATNLCLPSEIFAWLERRRESVKPIVT